MLSPADAWELLTLIKHIDHRSVAKEDAGLWAKTINNALTDVTLAQCKNAYAEWQSRPHDYSQVQPYDLIDIVKSHLPSKRLTEADIGRLLEPLDLSADELWAVRRELIAGVNRGLSQSAALSRALDAAHGHLLPSAPSRPKPTRDHHFIGNLRNTDIGTILGKEQL